MSQFTRGGFMKPLFVTAVGAVPAHAAVANKTAWPFFDSDLSSSSTNLEHGPQQLRIAPSGSPLAFQNFLRINNEWKPATLPNNPFITGDSFPLVTSQVKLEDSRIRCIGEGKAEGADGKSLSYAWDSDISAVCSAADAAWLRSCTTLHLPASIQLRQNTR